MTAQTEATSILEFLCADQKSLPTAKQVETFSDTLTRVTVGVRNMKRSNKKAQQFVLKSLCPQNSVPVFFSAMCIVFVHFIVFLW